MDLDFVLGVISDGPTKSYAFRRLQYLRGKFNMYTLLNEVQEMTEMKVRSVNVFARCSVTPDSPDRSVFLTGNTNSHSIDLPNRPPVISIMFAKSIRTFTTRAA
jgi:hypothetical protein